jgi:hypothetical protein
VLEVGLLYLVELLLAWLVVVEGGLVEKIDVVWGFL